MVFENNVAVGIIYFLYGLAFFTMGMTIAVKFKKSHNFILANSLWLLILFGLTQGVHEWEHILFQSDKVSQETMDILQLFHTFLVGTAFFFLFLFGIAVNKENLKKIKNAVALPVGVYLVWLLFTSYTFATKGVYGCSNDMIAMARYFIGIPGSLLVAVGLFSYKGENYGEFPIPKEIVKNTKYLGIVFVFYAFFIGLFVPQAAFFPATILNGAVFYRTFGVPSEFICGGSAIVVMFFIISILDRYELETKRFMENKVKLKELETQQAKEYLASITEGSVDAIISMDLNGNIKSWNNGAEKMFGFTSDEVVGKNYFETLVPGNAREDVQKIMANIVKIGYLQNYETLRRKKDGNIIPVGVSVTAFKDSNGNFAGASCIIRDHTEKNKLEEQLLQAEKMAALGQLASGIAHEINNPLTNIMLNAERLQKMISDTSTRDVALEEIIQEAETTTKITRALLDYARQSEPNFTLININEIMESALNILSFNLGSIKINKNYDHIPHIYGDYNKVLQVFINVLNNSIQAMENKGEITIHMANSDNFLKIGITDTGAGIPEKNLGKIFDPFFTTKKIGEGTGLGLSISQGIIKKHGGYINVESKESIGTTFTIGLPVGDRDGADISN